jgi:hypothetical protein
MYTYAIEFDLDQRGDAAEDFLFDAARTWPGIWGDLPGVTGTLLLSSAFALGGEYAYQWRVDIESLSTLVQLDDALKSGDKGWKRASTAWFRARTRTRAQVHAHVGGDRDYTAAVDRGPVHVALPADVARADDGLADVVGVNATRSLRPVLGHGAGETTWVRLGGLDALDSLGDRLAKASSPARVFGEIREIDGALFTGA